ncbi:class I SAM-dependent methyltransferase [Candidatus Neomarinimicrobiota bacterium]
MLIHLIKRIPGAKQTAKLLRLNKGAMARRLLLDLLPKHSIGAEIGVHLGDFSKQIIKVVSPNELHLIDPWIHQISSTYKDALYGGKTKDGQNEMDKRYERVCRRFDKQINANIVKVHRGLSSTILKQFSDEYFDWIYIDGNHLYEYVKIDLKLSLKKIKSFGFITGDDYSDGGWWKGGVKKAVDEFCRNQAIQLIEIRNRQYILQKTI